MAAANQTNRMGGLGANGEVYKPIIMATPNFEPEADAERLEKAMKGMGTDEKALIDVLCHRTAEERGQIAKTYKSLFGKDLIKRIKSETSGNFGKCMRYLCLDAPTLRAKIIYDCIDGAGTDELGLIEILCSATNYEISEIRDAYRKVLEYKGKDANKRNLEKDLVGDTSGFFRRIMVAISQGERKEPDWSLFERAQQEGVECLIDRPKAMEFAKKLYEAGEGKLGTDEACFIRILGHESVWMIAAIDQAYQSLSKRSLRDAIKSEMSGDLCTACLAVLDFSLDRPSAFAQRLNKAIKGLGTKDDTLIRICCTRADVDMCEIKESYRVQYGRTLAEDIKGDTSGDYKHALLALIGEY